MTIYFQTARGIAENATKIFLKKEAVSFPVRGWEEFSDWLEKEQPGLSFLLGRLKRSVDDYPNHPTYTFRGKPLALVWTADECRQLFIGLSVASKEATEKAYDFWEFTALVCCGISEEGIVSY